RHLEKWTAGRQQNAARYAALFEQAGLCDLVDLPATQRDCRHVYNQYTIRVKGGRRDELLASMRSQQIGAAVYYPIPLHLQECFAHRGDERGARRGAERAAKEVCSRRIFAERGAERQRRGGAGGAGAFGGQVFPRPQTAPAKAK